MRRSCYSSRWARKLSQALNLGDEPRYVLSSIGDEVLVLNRRDHEPFAGREVLVDVEIVQANRYAYAGGDPVNAGDQTGYDQCYPSYYNGRCGPKLNTDRANDAAYDCLWGGALGGTGGKVGETLWEQGTKAALKVGGRFAWPAAVVSCGQAFIPRP